MEKSNKIDAIEVEYDALKNETTELLDDSVINASIGRKQLGLSDTIMLLQIARYYEGKELNNNANLLFGINEITHTPSKPTRKIVILIDGERMEIDAAGDYVCNKEERPISPVEIYGLNPCAMINLERRTIEFTLQPNDIKRIADAKDVGLYIDSDKLYDVTGGDIQFRSGKGSFQIEGIQGAMKRAYHYFVDETCYADYCSSFLERKQNLLAEEEKWVEGERQKRKQEEKKEEELWLKERKKYLIILAVSVGLFIIGCILEAAFNFEGPTWLILLEVVGFLYSGYKLLDMYGIIDNWMERYGRGDNE